MLVHWNLLVFIFVFFNGEFFWVQSFTGPHIADVNILLPPKMTHPVESWDHHDILSVVPEYNESNHCSTSARLRSIAPYTGRKETAVFAADVHTGTVIRCKVYIDMFSKIQIFHSSVKLDLDGLATLRVRAFDSEDNVFSSLVGLRFMWRLLSESDESSHHLVHVPLGDSPLSDCSGFCGDLNIQIKLENSGVFSDLFVVKGVGIGHEIVSVQLLEPQFDDMTDKITLTVAEAMSLDPPSPVLVLVVVPLPSPFHQWSALNTSIAQVDSMKGQVHALKLGETSVIVEDTRVAGHVQMSSFNVVLPDYISLYLLPLSKSGDPVEGVQPTVPSSRWYIVSDRQYLIILKVFSRGPKEGVIYITKNDDVKLYYDQPNWKNFPLPDSIAVKYGWQYSRILEATVEGLGKLSASLTYSTDHLEAKEVLKVVQEAMVCDQVRVETKDTSLSSILLPWSPDIYQEAELNAMGGCANTPADYRWLSSDSSIVSVSATGVIQAKRPGKVAIKVVSIFDNLNFDEASLKSNFKKNERFKSGSACSWTYIYAASAGRAVLHATFSNHVNNDFSRQILLKASAPIASFSPLIVRQAGDGNKFGGYWFDLEGLTHSGLKTLDSLYLAPGSHFNVLLSGGPERWTNTVGYVQTVEVLDEVHALPKDGALVHQVRNSEGNGYTILCEVLGNFVVVFKRGNLVGDDHPLPVVAEAKLRIECSFPSSIVVLADEPVNKFDLIQNAIQADRDPGRIRSMPITVANGRTIRVSAVGISNSGNAFANSSSIPLRWELNNCQELASWDEIYNFQMSISSWERYLRLENASGQCIVHAAVQNDFNIGSPSLSDASKNILRDAIRLQVTSKQQSGKDISSQTIAVEVYAKPVVHPSDIFLVPGASYVVFATFYGDGRAVICQAQGKVIVGIPHEAILNVQSEQLAVGREMPVFPFLVEVREVKYMIFYLFSFYELCKNYKWSIENEKVSFYVILEITTYQYCCAGNFVILPVGLVLNRSDTRN
ncbi:hypothetical protein RDABS01_022565 [Bienertia sinuspersici]